MRKLVLYIALLLIPVIRTFAIDLAPIPSYGLDYKKLYKEMNLENIVDFKMFEYAMRGYERLDVENKDIITLIDFSKPSTEERFYIINIKEKKLVLSSVVSHGRKSGENYATSFGNVKGSNKSSLGFYVTENTYQGGNGYSLILNGLERNFNDKAKERSIVMHAADYANPASVGSKGRLGRSQGCPALPKNVNNKAIDLIKNGTIMFIYANNHQYLTQSKLLKKA